MGEQIVGAIITLVAVGFIANLNSAAIVGGVFSVRSGWRPGFAFLAGASAVRVVQGLFGLGVVYSIVDTFLGAFKLDTTTYVLMVIAGLAVVLAGVRQLLGRDSASAGPQQLEESAEAGSASSRTALIASIAMNIISLRQWVFTSLAVSTISSLRPSWPVGLLLFAFYLVVSSWLTVGLLVIKAVRPDAAPKVMDRIAGWTERHVGAIISWMAIVIGVLFGGYGLYQLIQ
jgi:hypothetical protein